MGFQNAYNGKTDLYLHREVIQQHSEWLRERMPPPNADGSIVTMWMGDNVMEYIYHTMKFMYFGSKSSPIIVDRSFRFRTMKHND